MSFPINIPLKHQYIYKPDLSAKIRGENDEIDFAILHGNQILLYLERHQELRNQELLDAIENVKIRDVHNGTLWLICLVASVQSLRAPLGTGGILGCPFATETLQEEADNPVLQDPEPVRREG